MSKYTRFAVQHFSDLSNAGFDPAMYSRLKFGSDNAARTFGYSLAQTFFAAHSDKILANRLVVIPSPYNHVRNAATVMTGHFIDKLNELTVNAVGRHVEYSTIHRKVSYTNDYGFMSKEKRRGLIDNDEFYMNKGFYEGKLLVFIDDIRITGTHEDKLREILVQNDVQNEAMFLYFAEYHGEDPTIEAALNFAHIKKFNDYLKLMNEPDHLVIVRPIKYVLSQTNEALMDAITSGEIPAPVLKQIYHGCLAEGYYRIPHYQQNFGLISESLGYTTQSHIPKENQKALVANVN